jgi:endonuclease/exonuclease/phosphatase family metal-dependent hydrolase
MPLLKKEEKNSKGRPWLLLWLNAGAVAVLLLCYAAAAFPPSTMGYLALLGLGYPIVLFLNVLLIVIWAVKKSRYIFISLIAVLVGWGHLTSFFQVSLSPSIDKEKAQLKVLSYNVHMFDVFDKKDGVATRDKIYDLLVAEKADVLCFQEFYQSEKSKKFPTRDTLIRFLPNKHYHERYSHVISGQQYFGLTIFSKYPIIKKGFVPFSTDSYNSCIYVDIVKGNDTLRIYNAHLQSIRFSREDYELAEGKTEQDELDDVSKQIARRLKTAFQKRQEQAERLSESIEACPHRIILCGDFNDPPVSYTYHTLTERLDDSFKACGNGVGTTYIGAFPAFRIDYILHSPELETIDYSTLPDELSDHHPITSTFQWK